MAVMMVALMMAAVVVAAAAVAAIVIDDATGYGEHQRTKQAKAGDLAKHDRSSSVVDASIYAAPRPAIPNRRMNSR